MNLEAVVDAIWAKTDRVDGTDAWLCLRQHLIDSADTAGYIWDEFLPTSLKSQLVKRIGDEESARCLARLLAGTHDIGKSTAAFQIQGTELLVNHCRDVGLDMPVTLPDRKDLPHALAGQLIFERWLTEHHNWGYATAKSYSAVTGGHHGVFTTAIERNLVKQAHHLFGEGLWTAAQDSLLTQMCEHVDADRYLSEWAQRKLHKTTQILLTAIVITSDWIASNTDYFDYGNYLERRLTRSYDGWKALRLPTPWQAKAFEFSVDELLRQRFGLPDTVSARPIQTAVLDVARSINTPGLFIIEAPMGIGKTEAALILAEELAARLGLGGLFFALPSMATSDAIFSRVHRWLETVAERPESVFLAHGKSHLNDEYQGIARSGHFAGLEQDSTEQQARVSAVVHEWLSGRKKGVLASFAVGTIDQVLFAALKSKHVALRHLGLAGKVVILDEVHAADEYMAVYLDRALEWLGAYGVPVILLSATLPGERRKKMVQAYDMGRGAYQPRSSPRPRPGQASPVAPTTPYDCLGSLDGYPLITATDTLEPLTREVPAGTRESSIDVATLPDTEEALTGLLAERLVEGGCAVVIRNTVGRAQQTYAHLREIFGEDVTLLHSRFVATDRMRREERVCQMFGPPGPDAKRPSRHVVVATQVVEQSLDIDFDLMITDIAPIDLILQRSGRLHRHSRTDRPEAVSTPQLFVTGVEWAAALPEIDKGAAAIYGDDALLRSLAVLGLPAPTTVNIPRDVPRLVQTAYGDHCPEPSGWEGAMSTARAKAEVERVDREGRAAVWLLPPPGDGRDVTGLTSHGIDDLKSDAKGQAAVRDSQESLEVIVIQQRDDGQNYRWGADPDEAPLPTDLEIDNATAHRVSACTLRLAPQLTTPWQMDRTIAALEVNLFPGWQSSRWLREQLVLVLDEKCHTIVEPFDLSYSDESGLVVTDIRKTVND